MDRIARFSKNMGFGNRTTQMSNSKPWPTVTVALTVYLHACVNENDFRLAYATGQSTPFCHSSLITVIVIRKMAPLYVPKIIQINYNFLSRMKLPSFVVYLIDIYKVTRCNQSGLAFSHSRWQYY